jgi:Domain of unknown function (DUF4440)
MELENARISALDADNLEALTQLMSDDLVHIHATGLTENKTSYLAGVALLPRRSSRLSTAVRMYGNMAVLTGKVTNRVRRPGATSDEISNLMVTQVACKETHGWRFVSYHATRIPMQSDSE